MKRILFIAHTASCGGGSEKVLSTLIDELADEYLIDVVEILSDTISPFKSVSKNVRYLGSLMESDRKAASRGGNIKLNHIRHNLLALECAFFPGAVYRRLVKERYDYEISFNYLYSSSLIAHSPNPVSKKIMWMHGAIDDLNDKEADNSLKMRLYRKIQHKAFSGADAIVTISRRTHKSVSIFQPDAESKIHDIYNGYDLDEISRLAREKAIDRSGRFRLVSVGRLSSAKNVLLQVEAVENLQKKGIDIELVLLGEGELKADIIKIAKGNPNIRPVGFQSNPYPYILSSDALIITSLAEGFPTVAVEAMALGKPVISTPVAGTDELISEETGLLIDWNADSVVDGILKAMDKPWDSDKIHNKVMPYTKQRWASNVKNLLTTLDNEPKI